MGCWLFWFLRVVGVTAVVFPTKYAYLYIPLPVAPVASLSSAPFTVIFISLFDIASDPKFVAVGAFVSRFTVNVAEF